MEMFIVKIKHHPKEISKVGLVKFEEKMHGGIPHASFHLIALSKL